MFIAPPCQYGSAPTERKTQSQLKSLAHFYHVLRIGRDPGGAYFDECLRVVGCVDLDVLNLSREADVIAKG